MSQTNKLYHCPICGQGYINSYKEVDNWVIVQCERCGNFKVDRLFAYDDNQPWKEIRHLLSAWVRRENKVKRVVTIAEDLNIDSLYSTDWVDQFRQMGFPETFQEKLDALLLAFAEMIKSDYKRQISYGLPHLIAEIAARDIEEVNGLIDFLKEKGYVDQNPRITVKGWEHIDELRKSVAVSNSAFVAMWFDDSTQKYRNAVLAAIQYSGYKPIIVDQQHYNDFVMNQVITLIKQSRFLVADFTSRPEIENDVRVLNGVRGGVYWEAGMAFGLGRPVIHTCEDSIESRNRIHFDVNQYNTIFWKDDDLGIEIRPLDQPRAYPNFAEKLSARILATVGKGNYQGDGK